MLWKGSVDKCRRNEGWNSMFIVVVVVDIIIEWLVQNYPTKLLACKRTRIWASSSLSSYLTTIPYCSHNPKYNWRKVNLNNSNGKFGVILHWPASKKCGAFCTHSLVSPYILFSKSTHLNHMWHWIHLELCLQQGLTTVSMAA